MPNGAKYLDMTMDAVLRWKIYEKKTRKELRFKTPLCAVNTKYIASLQANPNAGMDFGTH